MSCWYFDHVTFEFNEVHSLVGKYAMSWLCDLCLYLYLYVVKLPVALLAHELLRRYLLYSLLLNIVIFMYEWLIFHCKYCPCHTALMFVNLWWTAEKYMQWNITFTVHWTHSSWLDYFSEFPARKTTSRTKIFSMSCPCWFPPSPLPPLLCLLHDSIIFELWILDTPYADVVRKNCISCLKNCRFSHSVGCTLSLIFILWVVEI